MLKAATRNTSSPRETPATAPTAETASPPQNSAESKKLRRTPRPAKKVPRTDAGRGSLTVLDKRKNLRHHISTASLNGASLNRCAHITKLRPRTITRWKNNLKGPATQTHKHTGQDLELLENPRMALEPKRQHARTLGQRNCAPTTTANLYPTGNQALEKHQKQAARNSQIPQQLPN